MYKPTMWNEFHNITKINNNITNHFAKILYELIKTPNRRFNITNLTDDGSNETNVNWVENELV